MYKGTLNRAYSLILHTRQSISAEKIRKFTDGHEKSRHRLAVTGTWKMVL